MADETKKQQQAAADPREKILFSDLAGMLTIDGKPALENIQVDPETGDLISIELSTAITEQLHERAKQAAAAAFDMLVKSDTDIIELQQQLISAKKESESLDIKRLREPINTIIDTFINEDTRSLLRDVSRDLNAVTSILDEIEELRPIIEEELKKPGYNGKTLDELLRQYRPIELAFLPESDDLYRAIIAARSMRGDPAGQLPQISYNAGAELQTSTDKLSNLFFSLAAPAKIISGQRTMLNIPRSEMIPLEYDSPGGQDVTVFYDFNFNDAQLMRLGINKEFDSQDYFIASILDTLFLENNYTVSLTKIWHELGGKGSPTSDQLTPIYNRLVRGLSTTIVIDDKEIQEAQGNKPGDKYKEIVSPVMPVQIASEKFRSNGKVANATIKINQLSPLFLLSQSTGQFTTWKKEIMQLYGGRKTTRYFSVMQCLMQHIARINRAGGADPDNKLTYTECYNRNKDRTSRDKQLTREMIYRLLNDVFIPAGYVRNYAEDSSGDPGVIVECTPNTAAIECNKYLFSNDQ